MFWVGFTSVFSLLGSAIYGFLVFITLTIGIISAGFLYDTIKNIVKKKLNDKSTKKGLLYNKNVIVTGGSSGIGKCVAILAARQGANVTIIARSVDKLESSRDEIERACRHKDGQHIEYLSLNVSRDYAEIEKAFAELEERQGPCHLLVNCAGTAICGKIEDTTPETLKQMVDLNLIGSYYCTKAVVPKMKLAKEGRIVLVSSQAALLGIFGYSAYCCTKFALRGLAESLAMELSPYNVSVTLSLPPDTDTPGFAMEEKTKPLETRLISESGGLVQPEVVAEQLLNDTLDGKFFSIVGMESFILTTLCSGMSPYSSFSELLLQAVLMGPFRIVSAFFLYSFQNVVTRCMKEREEHKKSE